ncbi:MAG: histidinol-phosphatase [Candidatus Zixiibacteriota bacterium]
MANNVGNWHCYSGVIHVHTTESDGTKTIEEVAAIGQEVGLDFMMFTDHMTLSNKENGKEGFYGNTLVTVGYEHNDAEDNNHYLLFDSPSVYPPDFTASQVVAAGAEDRAVGIIAHPDEIRDRLGKYPPFPWTDWSCDKFTGIELWNQMSEWMERLRPYNKLIMAFSPRKSMVGPPRTTLQRWDEINLRRKCAGIAAVDAHAFPIQIGPLRVEIFPYKVHFRSLRTYVLLREPMSRDFATAKQQLYDAIRDCRLFFANLRWGDADGFDFSAQNGSESAVSGGQVEFRNDTVLEIILPARARIKVLRNGRPIYEVTDSRATYRVNEPGLYRVETWKWKRGWIFSNHIRIGQ